MDEANGTIYPPKELRQIYPVKITQIHEDEIEVWLGSNRINIKRGDSVVCTGKRDWGNLVTVVGRVKGWTLRDGWLDCHASLDLTSLYDKDKEYSMAWLEMIALEHWQLKT